MRRVLVSIGCLLAGALVSGRAAPTETRRASQHVARPEETSAPRKLQAAREETAGTSLRIISDITLPEAYEWACDVRWASDKSVYLALDKEGVAEYSFTSPAAAPKELIPGGTKPGGFWLSRQLAASSEYLVAAGPANSLTWRRIQEPTRSEEAFSLIQAIDVRSNRLAIVGARRDENGVFAPDGAIAWVGPLNKGLGDLRPLLYDIQGPGAPIMNRCAVAPLGAVRFLSDGSLVVVPGTQPGISIFDPEGKLVRTWETSSLGIDTDCASLPDLEGRRLAADSQRRQAWINQRHTVDAVLPFGKGPGVVVRSIEKGHTRWEIKFLRLGGPVEALSVPVEGGSELFTLKGDVRGTKLVLLVREILFRASGRSHPTPPRLLVMEPPKDWGI